MDISLEEMPTGRTHPPRAVTRGLLMPFALSSLCFLILGAALPFAAAHIQVFRHNRLLLVAVHAFTLGMTALLMAACYHLVPAWLRQPPADRRQGLGQTGLLAAGIALLLAGFYWWAPLLLASGGTCIGLAAIWFAALVAPGLIRSLPGRMTAVGLAGAVVALLLLVSLGVTLALNLRLDFLPAGALSWLGAHLVLGVGGWFGLGIIGVSYQLATGLYQIPRRQRMPWEQWLGWLLLAALAALALALVTGLAPARRPLTAVVALVGLFYAVDFGWRLLHRGLPGIDPTLVHLLAAVCSLALACAGLLAWAAGWHPGNGSWSALGLLLLPGWVGNMGMGVAYRMVPSQTWRQHYAPQVSLRQVPAVTDLLPWRLPWCSALLWNLGVLSLAVLAPLGAGPAWQQAAGLAAGLGALAYAVSILHVLLSR